MIVGFASGEPALVCVLAAGGGKSSLSTTGGGALGLWQASNEAQTSAEHRASTQLIYHRPR